MKQLTFSKSIRQATSECLSDDNSLICFGLGVTDPKGVFGTTKDLHIIHGNERVFDIPISENAMTGIGIGAAIMGTKVLMVHQRMDFFLLAMDQLVNAASKMHYMYGGEVCCPITIRLIVGRGWGQGPTHSQSLHSWFAHIPGLKVVMPTFPKDAYKLLKEAISDPNPVIFIEHRWLHETSEDIDLKDHEAKIGECRVCAEGSDITIVASSYLTLESLKARSYLKKKHKINAEVIDLTTIKPIDYGTIKDSLKKTRRLCVVDSGARNCGIASEIISYFTEKHFDLIDFAPIKLAMPDCPEPTSYGLTRGFYIRAGDIVKSILKGFNQDETTVDIDMPEPIPHDVPGTWFKGPF